MALESGMTALPDDGEHHWQIGALPGVDGLDIEVIEDGDDGLDDLAENEGEDQDAALDGSIPGVMRMTSRLIQLHVKANELNGDGLPDPEVLAVSLQEIRKAVTLLPDRTQTRLLRWRRAGEPAKRIAYRPARGKAMVAPGDELRLARDRSDPVLRLEAPNPVILSDEYHEHTFSAGETFNVVNAGSFCAVLPTAWWLTCSTGVTIENLDYDEYVRFPAGPVTVPTTRFARTSSTFNVAYGPGSVLLPRWPLLRPGDNAIKASAACTFRWRDTW